jgi:L-xylulokinase
VHPRARAGFFNIFAGHTFADLARALLEGITFDHRNYLEKFMNQGLKWDKVRLAGGGAKSAFWSQMFADILQCPIEISEAEEMGALGVAMSATVGAGIYKNYDEAIAKCVRIKKVVTPIAENTKAYMKRYEHWQATMKHMMKIWDEGTHV